MSDVALVVLGMFAGALIAFTGVAFGEVLRRARERESRPVKTAPEAFVDAGSIN